MLQKAPRRQGPGRWRFQISVISGTPLWYGEEPGMRTHGSTGGEGRMRSRLCLHTCHKSTSPEIARRPRAMDTYLYGPSPTQTILSQLQTHRRHAKSPWKEGRVQCMLSASLRLLARVEIRRRLSWL